jgi:hypothetical protein
LPLGSPEVSPEEAAWSAGLFEGEGCITTATHNHKATGVTYKYPVLQMNMTDQDVMERFAEIVECGTLRGPLTHKNTNYKPFWNWSVGRRQHVERLMGSWEPWLHARRKARYLELCESRGRQPK